MSECIDIVVFVDITTECTCVGCVSLFCTCGISHCCCKLMFTIVVCTTSITDKINVAVKAIFYSIFCCGNCASAFANNCMCAIAIVGVCNIVTKVDISEYFDCSATIFADSTCDGRGVRDKCEIFVGGNIGDLCVVGITFIIAEFTAYSAYLPKCIIVDCVWINADELSFCIHCKILAKACLKQI